MRGRDPSILSARVVGLSTNDGTDGWRRGRAPGLSTNGATYYTCLSFLLPV